MKKANIKMFESYNAPHRRVIPRDFFNEAKLLKCMGVLRIKIMEGGVPNDIDIQIEETGEPFNILLDTMFEILHVSNYPVLINNEQHTVGTRYNSKDNFPFFVIVEDYDIRILDEDGMFTDEFVEYFE